MLYIMCTLYSICIVLKLKLKFADTYFIVHALAWSLLSQVGSSSKGGYFCAMMRSNITYPWGSGSGQRWATSFRNTKTAIRTV